MQKKYIILDFQNMAYRAKHIAFNNADVDTVIGLAMHTIFNSIRYSYENFGGDHLVVCVEGKSWRKKTYPRYKLNRKLKESTRTEKEIAEDDLFFEAIDEMRDFLNDKTNATVLRCEEAEADDMASMWIKAHPGDKHIIISTDSDFYQLLADNVEIYNGVTEQHITINGFFDKLGKPILDKDGNPKEKINPKYMLFEKCIRGDTSDNIFPAYPGVRSKGTKNKIGIIEAFNDMDNKGYAWNNFMMQKWVDDSGKEHLVKDDYEINKSIIDLDSQPEDIKVKCLESINRSLDKKAVVGVGAHLVKFCALHGLDKISKYPESYAKILNSKY